MIYMSERQVFGSRDVTWELDGITMEGTVTWPLSQGTYPGVVLVAGSGPTDRNWCSPLLPGTNGSGGLIAEALTAAGYATIRYDKRASGPHVQENIQSLMGKMSMESHLLELQKAVQALLDNTKVEKDGIFALTSSEGAIHAVNYQLREGTHKFKGMVLTGVPGRSVGEVARDQMRAQISAMGNSESLMRHFDKSMEDFREGKPYIPDPSIPEGMSMLLRSVTSPANQPFSRELFVTNPTDIIKQIEVPVLIVIGKKDIQVNWETDGDSLREALASKDNLSMEFPENANHVLKHEDTPREQLIPMKVGENYNSDKVSLDEDTVEIILSWLNRQSGITHP